MATNPKTGEMAKKKADELSAIERLAAAKDIAEMKAVAEGLTAEEREAAASALTAKTDRLLAEIAKERKHKAVRS